MVPLPDRWLSSVLVRYQGSLILFDCGEGTQISWRRYHWGFRRLDAICLSHLHADHVAGLPGLLHTVANAGRVEPLVVYGPVGTGEAVDGLRVIARRLPFEVQVRELSDGDQFALADELRGTVRVGLHRVPVLGYRLDLDREPAFDRDRAIAMDVPRVEWSRLQAGESVTIDGRTILADEVRGVPRQGVSFAFVTDTRPTDALAELLRDADFVVCEATYGDDEDQPKAELHRHMTVREAATLAARAGVGTLWLTHFGAGMTDPEAYAETARSVFPGAVMGAAGLTGRLTFRNGYESVKHSG
jgi:ribonuclease Z